MYTHNLQTKFFFLRINSVDIWYWKIKYFFCSQQKGCESPAAGRSDQVIGSLIRWPADGRRPEPKLRRSSSST